MPVAGLNHVNIRTTDLEASVRFYVDALGFSRSDLPMAGRQGAWLRDAEGAPLIHLIVRPPDGETTGAVDHVAFTCRGRAAMSARLEAHGIAYRTSENIVPGLSQIFLRDPHGVALELNFADG